MQRVFHYAVWCYFIVLTLLLLSPDFSESWRRGVPTEEYTHLYIFTLLALFFELDRQKKSICVFLTAYALGTEILQGLLSPWFHRCCNLQDIVQDLAGIQLGLTIAFLCRGAARRIR